MTSLAGSFTLRRLLRRFAGRGRSRSIEMTRTLLLALAVLGAVLPAFAQPPGFDQRRENIPHGTVIPLEYDSKTVGIPRRLRVYTPPGYRAEERLPVLYLLHGIGGDEKGWQAAGAADAILDYLYAQKKAARMLVVLPNGRASAEPPPANPFDGNPMADYARFEGELLRDVIPFVESRFAVQPGREGRAIAGLSMGGGQALNFGLAHPETFAWVGGFSSAPNTRPAAALANEAEKANLRLLWLSCGDSDFLLRISQDLHNALTAKRVAHLWYVDKGGHDWPVWKNDLYEFAQRVFQSTPPPSPVSPGTISAAAPRPQPPAPGPASPPQIVSPEAAADRRLTFRLYAPNAQSVRLFGSDLPGLSGQGAPMKKDDRGVWETILDPVPPGAYRYQFQIDGATALDPRNPATSESAATSWSLAVVPGSERLDTRNVPHGAVASIPYYSTALSRFRRVHVYTPPGYEKGEGTYPVFYLLHGAGDSDDSWTSVGRAGFILDNLLAEGKARPMIVVMPAGHTRPFGGFGSPPPAVDEFTQDFTQDLMPLIESRYRTRNDRASRAIAGLSMGGFQTLNIAIPKLDSFAYIGVFSSGLFGIVPRQRPGEPPAPPAASFPWEEQNRARLDDAALKKGLKLLWFGIGAEDFLLATSRASAALFKKHGFEAIHHETAGGHTWLNWRDYLILFAPKLFQ